MTPAILQAQRVGMDFVVHEYERTATGGYGAGAAAALGLPPARVFKTLIAKLDGDGRRLVVAVVPVGGELDLKRLAKAAGGKRAGMATNIEAERSTGFVVGGISPLGQRHDLRTFIDRRSPLRPSS
jgi:Cys-tRNA(Pro)/Cys-tRNA(Cys) deacylase